MGEAKNSMKKELSEPQTGCRTSQMVILGYKMPTSNFPYLNFKSHLEKGPAIWLRYVMKLIMSSERTELLCFSTTALISVSSTAFSYIVGKCEVVPQRSTHAGLHPTMMSTASVLLTSWWCFLCGFFCSQQPSILLTEITAPVGTFYQFIKVNFISCPKD